jgi:hypothetical protein
MRYWPYLSAQLHRKPTSIRPLLMRLGEVGEAHLKANSNGSAVGGRIVVAIVRLVKVEKAKCAPLTVKRLSLGPPAGIGSKSHTTSYTRAYCFYSCIARVRV